MQVATVIVAITASAVMSSCAARSRMGQAVVEGRQGQPCFSLEDTTLTRRDEPRLRAVTVYNMSGPARGVAWAFRMPPQIQGELFSPPACNPYGVPPNGAIVETVAQELAPGVTYSVSINARGTDGSDPTFAYSAEFCLLRNPDQTLRVHQIQWDAKARKWQREACGRP